MRRFSLLNLLLVIVTLLCTCYGYMTQQSRTTTKMPSVSFLSSTMTRKRWSAAGWNNSEKKESSGRHMVLFAEKPVTVTFDPSGKSVTAYQGDVLADVAKQANVYIPYKCKSGRCMSCELRLNGRVSVQACKNAQIPGGPTKNLRVQVMREKPV